MNVRLDLIFFATEVFCANDQSMVPPITHEERTCMPKDATRDAYNRFAGGTDGLWVLCVFVYLNKSRTAWIGAVVPR